MLVDPESKLTHTHMVNHKVYSNQTNMHQWNVTMVKVSSRGTKQVLGKPSRKCRHGAELSVGMQDTKKNNHSLPYLPHNFREA